MAIVGEVTRLAYRNAERAAMEGEALVIADSVMAQLLAGLIEPVDLPPSEWIVGNAEPIWRYSLTVEPTDLEELLTARVRVEQITDDSQPISVELIRWILDPALVESSSSSGGT